MHPDRPQYMGSVGPISIAQMRDWCAIADLDVEELLPDMRAMDAAFMKRAEQIREAEAARAKREAARTGGSRSHGAGRGRR